MGASESTGGSRGCSAWSIAASGGVPDDVSSLYLYSLYCIQFITNVDTNDTMGFMVFAIGGNGR
jgi:hypothetical protein